MENEDNNEDQEEEKEEGIDSEFLFSDRCLKNVYNYMKYGNHFNEVGNKPERTSPIDDEDIIDLKIALETSKTVEDFLQTI